MSLLNLATGLKASGFSFLPIRNDGSKAPITSLLPLKNNEHKWEPLQERLPTDEEISSWFSDTKYGLAIIGGGVSGNLGIIDIEFADYWELYKDIVEEKLPNVLATLPIIKTPGKDENGGRHIYFRTTSPVQTKKIASLSPEMALARNGKTGANTAIEIKAEGGYALFPGCMGDCHPCNYDNYDSSNRKLKPTAKHRVYEYTTSVRIENTPVLTTEQVITLLDCARLFNYKQEPETTYAGSYNTNEDDSPGSEFNKRGPNILDQLKDAGWTIAKKIGDTTFLRRPGKSFGLSGTYGHNRSKNGDPLFYPFTSSTEFKERKSYDAFGVYAYLNYAGNFNEAAKSLKIQGYGKQTKSTQNNRYVSINIDVDEIVAPIFEEKTPVFPINFFPQALQEYAWAVKETLDCTLDMPASLMVPTAAVAIGTTRAIVTKEGYQDYPVIYLGVVAKPGSAKTPCEKFVCKPIYNQQILMDRQYRLEKTRAQEAGADENVDEPVLRQSQTTNATVESLVRVLNVNPRGIAYRPDELAAWVRSLGQYTNNGDKSDHKTFFISSYNCSPITINRISLGKNPLNVNNPFVCVYGGIQPDLLSELCDEKGRQDGFIHRILFSAPPHRMLRWNRNIVPQRLIDIWDQTIQHFYTYGLRKDQDGRYQPKQVFFSREADEVVDDWFARTEHEMMAEDFPEMLEGVWMKIKTYMPRFVLIAHELRIASGEIDQDSLIDIDSSLKGMELAQYFKYHAKKVYPIMSQTSNDKDLLRIVERINKKSKNPGEVKGSELISMKLASNAEDARKKIQKIVDYGWGKLEQRENKNKLKYDVLVLNKKVGDK